MRPLARFCSPVDPVVAIHDRPQDAHATLAALAGAGFPGAMLEIVGRGCPLRGPAIEAVGHEGGARWVGSSLAWAAIWLAFAGTAALALPAAPVALAVLLPAAAMLTLVHAAAVAWRVAPRRTAAASWQRPTRSYAAHDRDLDADRLLVVVRGSRSDVATARAILHGATAPASA